MAGKACATFLQPITEQANSASTRIDSLSTAGILEVMNVADGELAPAVARELPRIGQAVDGIVLRLEKGGRLFYLGAGTSGRLGVLDASECPPTFHTPPDLVQGIIAGGDRALRVSVEGAEDEREGGARDLLERHFNRKDALVGIAASGRTPYVLGGLALARHLEAFTVGLSCVPDSAVARAADVAITPVPGPEILTGSTRLRAGTVTKLILNMLSTATMIRLGYVYGNLMVNVQPTNSKLADRAIRIISEIAEVPYDEASRLLAEGGSSVRAAIVMSRCGVNRVEAEARLAQANGNLRAALA